jgi:hypothetical protein
MKKRSIALVLSLAALTGVAGTGVAAAATGAAVYTPCCKVVS